MNIGFPNIHNFPDFEYPPMKYGYSNARVKGMKGLFLSQATLEEISKVRTIDAMIELLQRTPYKDELVRFSLNHRGSRLVEFASSHHFIKIVKKIRKFIPKKDIVLLDALLRKWDMLNLKVLINGRRLGRSYEEIRHYLVPVGSLDETDFQLLHAAPESELFEQFKKTALGTEILGKSTAIFTRQMKESFNNALRSFDVFLQLQIILDAYLYSFMENAFKNPNKDTVRILKIHKKEIDIKNILIIERLKARNMDKNKIRNYIIKGGTLSESLTENLINSDMEKVIQIVKSKFLDSDGIKESAASPMTLIDLEILLEKAIAVEKTKAFHRSVLSIGVILGFILIGEEEQNNLRKIAKAKEFGLSEQETRQMIVFV